MRRLLAATVAALACALAACGDDGEEGAAGPPPTVSVQQVDGIGDVLVDRDGAALYTADVEAKGEILCTGGCVDFWIPLEAGSAAPTGSDDVTGDLATVERPDGGTQVTYDGKPLYRFSEDTEPGEVTGNGFTDDFDGRTFTWQAATVEGDASGGSTGGGGYGY
jgi:predicted lipoprotein with Yx(FWY)xxD motif